MKRWDKCLRGFQGVIDQENLFFLPEELNAICRVDLRNKKAEIEIWMDNDSVFSSGGWFLSIILSNDYLILLPGKSEQVIIYDRKKKKLKRIDTCEPKITTNEIYNCEDKFFGGFVRDSNAYLLAATYPAILKINIDTGETEYIIDWIEGIRDRIPKEDDRYYFANGYVLTDHYAYIPGNISGTIIRLDFNTNKTCVFKSHSTIKMIHGLISYKEDLWVLVTTEQGNSLIKWSPERGFGDELLINNDPMEDVYWWKPVEIDGIFYLCHSRGTVYKVDLWKRKVIRCAGIIEAIGETPKINSKFLVRLIGVYKKKICFYNGWTGKWVEFDTVSHKIESFMVKITENDDEFDEKYWNAKLQTDSNKLYLNEWEIPLPKFMDVILQTDYFDQNI